MALKTSLSLFLLASGCAATNVWSPVGGGTDSSVENVAVYRGDLIACGNFTVIGGTPASHIARWDGAAWHAMGQGLNGPLEALAVHKGRLAVGGWFTVADSTSAARVAAWDGANWLAMGSGFDAAVRALATYETTNMLDRILVAGGEFTASGTGTASRVAWWGNNRWNALGQGFNSNVYALVTYNNLLVAAGAFTQSGTSAVNRIAYWNGAVWRPFGGGMNADIYALTVFNGDLVAAGDFTNAGGVAVGYIARWDGSAWHALGSATNDRMRALAVLDGALIAGWTIPHEPDPHAGPGRGRVSRWDGQNWTILGDFDNWVEGLTVHNHELIASGWFTSAAGASAVGLARLDIAASGVVPGQWGTTDTSKSGDIEWPTNWYGAHNPRAQWFKILAEKPTEWNYQNHVKGEPPFNTYYIYKFAQPLPEGTRLLLEGDFPHCRLFDIQVGPPWLNEMPAIGDGAGIPEIPILDQDIEPDPGSVNPFRSGVNRAATNRHYHVTFELRDGNPVDLNPAAGRPPYRSRGNLRYAGRRAGPKGVIDRGPYIFVRVYLPDRLDPYAAVEPPLLRVQYPGKTPVLAPVCQMMELNLQDLLPPYTLEENPAQPDGTSLKEREANEELKRRAGFDLAHAGAPGTYYSSLRLPPVWGETNGTLQVRKNINHVYFTLVSQHYGDADGGSNYICNTLPSDFLSWFGCGKNAIPPGNDEHASGTSLYNTYLATVANIRSGELFVVAGRLPSVPRTLSGGGIAAADGDLRSMILQMYAGDPDDTKLMPVVCMADEDIVADTNGDYMIVIGRPEHRPSNADAAHGITWREWPTGNVLRVDWRMTSTRQIPWSHAPQVVAWEEGDYWPPEKNPRAVRARMAEYYPTCRYLWPGQVEALGAVGTGGYERGYNHPPGVRLTAPTSSAILPSDAPVSLAASASDYDGAVTNAIFLCNGAPVAAAAGPPWAASVFLPEGVCVLTILATDNDGATNVSPPVSVTVMNPATDDNRDGLPDLWQWRHFGGTNAPGGGPQDDWDLDGMQNLAEYLAATDPKAPASLLEITDWRMEGTDSMILRWSGEAARFYVVRKTEDLTGEFAEMPTSVMPGTPPINTCTVVLDRAVQSFYRVAVLDTNSAQALFVTAPGSPWDGLFPCDALTVADGDMATGLRVDLPLPPESMVSDREDVAAVNRLDGFSIFPRITIPFVGAAPDASTFTTSTVFLVGLSASERGEKIPIDQRLVDLSTPGAPRLICAPDRCLRESSRYVLIVTTGLQAAGLPVRRPPALANLLGRYSEATAANSSYEAEVFDALDAIVANSIVPLDDLLTLSVFTTRTATDIPVKLRDRLDSGGFVVTAPDFDTDGQPGNEIFDADSVTSIVVYLHRASRLSDGTGTVTFDPGSLVQAIGPADWQQEVFIGNVSSGLRIPVPADSLRTNGAVAATDVSALVPQAGDELALLVKNEVFSSSRRPFLWSFVDRVAFGVFKAPSYTDGEGFIPVVSTGPGHVPDVTGTNGIALIAFLPAGAMPAGGWPVACYAHGGDGSFLDIGAFSSAPVLAARGLATAAFSAPGHGGGPGTTIEVATTNGLTVIHGSGRALDFNGDGRFEDDTQGRKHQLVQRISDFGVFIRSLQAGADPDGDDVPEFASVASNTCVFGISFGGRTTSALAAIEPAAGIFAANVPGAGGRLVHTGYFPRMEQRDNMRAYLAARTPQLLNNGSDFRDDIPLKNQPPQAGLAAGAEAIQRTFDFLLWRELSDCTAAYARPVATGARRGGVPAPYLLQIVRGDGMAPNPMQMLFARSGGLTSVTAVVRADVEPAFDAQYQPIPGNVSRHLLLAIPYSGFPSVDIGGHMSHLARVQIADFLLSRGATVTDPDGAGGIFAGDVFQFPASSDLLELMKTDPGYDWQH
ncbi:MAG: hypothetical protein C0404_04255 [Verrucomicrobia bacterium]|nr:hypothetical protein [Verrucomicrobiota bacterium]